MDTRHVTTTHCRNRGVMTSHSRKPIRSNKYDWMASFEDDEPDEHGHMPVGFGETERDAINDLMEQMA